jgi:quercetin dioxygenase-like cupin family protein
MHRRSVAVLVSFLGVVTAPVVLAQEAVAEAEANPAAQLIQASAESLAFGPLEVPGFASGMQVAVLTGDPFSAGPYVIRLAFPDGYTFPAHWHPRPENLTVIEGLFHLGMGTAVGATESYGPGDFLFIPPEHPHYGGATGHTVIQLHGEGPFEIKMAETGK